MDVVQHSRGKIALQVVHLVAPLPAPAHFRMQRTNVHLVRLIAPSCRKNDLWHGVPRHFLATVCAWAGHACDGETAGKRGREVCVLRSSKRDCSIRDWSIKCNQSDRPQCCLDAVPPAETWGTLLGVHPLCTRLFIDRALGGVLDDRVHRVHHRCFRPGVPGPHSGRPRRVVYGKKNG